MRGQLAALLAVLVTPMIVLQAFWGYREYRRGAERAGLEALALADATSVSVRQLLAVTEEVLSELADQYRPVRGNTEACDVIHALGSVFPLFAAVGATDRDGFVICSTRPVPAGVSPVVNFSWFERVRDTRRLYIGSPVDGPVSGTWVLPLSYPLLDADGRFVGTLFGSVPLLQFQDILAGVPLKRGHLITIATRDRMVVARSTDADVWVGRQLPPERLIASEIEPGRWIARGPDFDGIERDWGQVEVPGVDWTVYVGVRSDLAAGRSMRDALQRIGLSVLVLALGIFLGMRFYRDLAGALRQLVAAVEVAFDRKHVSLPIGTPSEVSDVVEQFNLVVDRFDKAEQRQQLLVQELDHRVKNILAEILALMVVTAQNTRSTESFVEAVTSRVHAMARLHEALATEGWGGLDVVDIVESTVSDTTSVGRDRLVVSGTSCALEASLAKPLGQALHELAVNAVKHGSLSGPDGRLDIRWEIEDDGTLVLRWTESDGPRVSQDPPSGLGLFLVTDLIEKGIGGAVSFGFPSAGVRHVLRVPGAHEAQGVPRS